MLSSPSSAQDDGRRRVTRGVLLQVYLRALFVQSGFNPRTLQGPGWAFAITPALTFLHRDPSTLEAAMRRHLGHFNTHPYFAAALLGGAVRLEERIASGLAPASAVLAFRQALASPLAAVGDAFFWSALRPACALAALIAVPVWGAWTAVLFLGAYNAIHLTVRTWSFAAGYHRVEGLVDEVGRLRLPNFTTNLRRLAALLAGAVAAMVATRDSGVDGAWVVSGAFLTLLVAGRWRRWQVALSVLGAAFLLGFLR